MRLKLNTAARRVRIEFLLNPGEEIEVPAELGAQLLRSYGYLADVKAPTAPKGAREEYDSSEVPGSKPAAKAKAKAKA